MCACICVWCKHLCAYLHYLYTSIIMTFSHVWRALFICVTWLIHMCDMTHSYVRHDSFISATWLIHMCDITHLYMWHYSHARTLLLSEPNALGISVFVHVCGVNTFMCIGNIWHVCWHTLNSACWVNPIHEVCVWLHVSENIYVHRYKCIYMHMCVYMYMHIHLCIHIQSYMYK